MSSECRWLLIQHCVLLNERMESQNIELLKAGGCLIEMDNNAGPFLCWSLEVPHWVISLFYDHRSVLLIESPFRPREIPKTIIIISPHH